MKRILLIFLCVFLLMSCSSVVKTNTLAGVDISETEIEVLPITADLTISEQKTKGEATGKIADLNDLTKEALAKALGQEPPSANMPDVLVGVNAFTEVDGADLKVILTGYPAYYTNFRTARAADSLRLNMFNSGAPPIIYNSENKPKAAASQIEGEWYFSMKYQFGDGFGWGIGTGKTWPSKQFGDLFFGLEIEERGIISPWKNEKDIEWFGLGGSLNAGGTYGDLPYDLKLVYGLSAGFWFSECSYERPYVSGYYNTVSYEYDTVTDQLIMVGPLVKLRWHGLEAGLRLLFGSDTDFQFALGFTI